MRKLWNTPQPMSRCRFESGFPSAPIAVLVLLFISLAAAGPQWATAQDTPDAPAVHLELVT
jgi:hypothetical protein